MKSGYTFHVLQEDDQESILEELLLPPITKIDKEGRKLIEGRGRRRMKKYLYERRKIEMVPNQDYQKTLQ